MKQDVSETASQSATINFVPSDALAGLPDLPIATATSEYRPQICTVIYATDLSSGSSAGRYAALFSKKIDAKLLAIHAFLPSHAAQEAEVVSRAPSRQRTVLTRLLKKALEQLEPFQSDATAALIEGEAVGAIRRLSEQYGPSLVVLGTQVRGAVKRCIFGSTAEKILRSINSPVLTVGPHASYTDQLAIRRILFATDFSPAASHAVSCAVFLARTFESEITLLHVAPETGGPAAANGDNSVSAELQSTVDALLHFNSRYNDVPLRIRPILRFGNARDQVLRQVCEEKYDLIVMGTHHHSTLARHLRTSLVLQTIVKANCPVLTVG